MRWAMRWACVKWDEQWDEHLCALRSSPARPHFQSIRPIGSRPLNPSSHRRLPVFTYLSVKIPLDLVHVRLLAPPSRRLFWNRTRKKRYVSSAVSSIHVRFVCFLGQNDGIIEYSPMAGLTYGYPHSKVDDSRASPLLCTNFKHIVLRQFWRSEDDPGRLLRALVSSIVCVNAILLSLELTSYYSSAGTRSLSAAALIAES